MAYTAAQQAQIDAQKLIVTNAQNAYNSSLSTLAARDASAREQWAEVFKCKGFLGTTKNYEPLSTGTCGSAVNNNAYPNCTSNATCQARVTEFNTRYAYWDSYKSTVEGYRLALVQANAQLQAVLNQVAFESGNDPETLADIAAADEEAKTKRTRWIIFGVIVVSVLVIGYLIYRKYKK